MRTIHTLAATAALGTVATMLLDGPADAQCSVFSRHPCAPTVCSVFQRRPCLPEFAPPIGEDLRLTIETSQGGQAEGVVASADNADPGSEHKLNTLRDLFAALRGCWVALAPAESRAGMQMSVRFAFKRNGEIIGAPRVTYVSPDAPADVRDRYRTAITAALDRCTPMPFTRGLGGAVAGRPIAIRFVDNRNLEKTSEQP